MANNIITVIKNAYDKILAIFVIILLIGSVVYLALRIRADRDNASQIRTNIKTLVPLHKNASSVSNVIYEQALNRLENPTVISTNEWTIRLIVPEARIKCMECGQPIPWDAVKCPACNSDVVIDQPIVLENADTDNDGMKDLEEKKYGFDPNDASDAEKDADNDEFTNLEEISAGTSPLDPNSKPPYETRIYVKKTRSTPFKLLFKGASTMPSGEKIFQINTRRDGTTVFARMSNEVDGFKIINYQSNSVQKFLGGKTYITEDTSELTLQRGAKKVVLIMGETNSWSEFAALLWFKLDNSEKVVKQDEKFDIRGSEYLVNKIDIDKEYVQIARVSDGRSFVLKPYEASKDVEPQEKEVPKDEEAPKENVEPTTNVTSKSSGVANEKSMPKAAETPKATVEHKEDSMQKETSAPKDTGAEKTLIEKLKESQSVNK